MLLQPLAAPVYVRGAVMIVSQAPSQRPLIREPESVGIDALPVLYSYPPLHGWTLHSLMFPAVVRCAACDGTGIVSWEVEYEDDRDRDDA